MIDLNNNIRNAPMNDAIQFIINQKNVNMIDNYEQSMLHHSCLRKDGFPLVELLLFLGINKELRDRMNSTAWTYA